MGRLIAISNRTAADPSARAGGLAVAVWESLKSTGGVWFGWSGDVVEKPSRSVQSLKDDGVEFVLTDLSEDEHDQYYLQYANSVLWPVFVSVPMCVSLFLLNIDKHLEGRQDGTPEESRPSTPVTYQ